MYSLKLRGHHTHSQRPYIAAFDAPQCCKDYADFVCDGVDDAEEINAAQKSIGQGTLFFSPGSFFPGPRPIR